MDVSSGCGCKEVYRFPHSTYPYSSCICSFLQQHPYFFKCFSFLYVSNISLTSTTKSVRLNSTKYSTVQYRMLFHPLALVANSPQGFSHSGLVVLIQLSSFACSYGTEAITDILCTVIR